MMKYKGNYFSLITMVIKKPMVRQYGKEQTKKWLKGAKTVYKQMLAETEDIGADNPMVGNIYSGFVFMAIWKAADGAIKVEDFNRVAAEMMDRPIVRKLKGGTDMNKQKDRDEMNAQFHRLADWAKAHPQYKDKTWDFHVIWTSVRRSCVMQICIGSRHFPKEEKCVITGLWEIR